MSFGDELKRARELREISVREVSEATKISVRYLEALERNDFTDLPGGVYRQGFVRAIAQYIGVDGDDLYNAYLLEERNQQGQPVDDDETLDVLRNRTRPTGDPDDAAPAARSRLGLWIGLVVVLAAAAVAAWWFFGRGPTP